MRIALVPVLALSLCLISSAHAQRSEQLGWKTKSVTGANAIAFVNSHFPKGSYRGHSTTGEFSSKPCEFKVVKSATGIVVSITVEGRKKPMEMKIDSKQPLTSQTRIDSSFGQYAYVQSGAKIPELFVNTYPHSPDVNVTISDKLSPSGLRKGEPIGVDCGWN